MACPACTPELAPAGPRRHEEHHGVRFHDWHLVVLKDSVTIDDCYEVDLRAGQAWRYREPLRLCECGAPYAEAYIDSGRFAVREPGGTHHEE
jgi:hypothetical protein